MYKFIEHVVLENTEILGRLEARAKRLNEVVIIGNTAIDGIL